MHINLIELNMGSYLYSTYKGHYTWISNNFPTFFLSFMMGVWWKTPIKQVYRETEVYIFAFQFIIAIFFANSIKLAYHLRNNIVAMAKYFCQKTQYILLQCKFVKCPGSRVNKTREPGWCHVIAIGFSNP